MRQQSPNFGPLIEVALSFTEDSPHLNRREHLGA
jgi:hypothetical protein